jgi:D-alanyl-D-alanine carboxypeptidase
MEFIMKRVSYVIIAVALLLFLTFVPVFPPDTTPALHAVTSNIKACGFMSEDVVISAEKAILVDKTTGLVLYAKNADSPSGMASTTKIMTAIVVLENMLLSEEIEITNTLHNKTISAEDYIKVERKG